MVTTPANFLRACLVLGSVTTVGMAAPTAASAQATAVANYKKTIQPMLQRYCYDCHGDGMAKGELAFDELNTDAKILSAHDVWFKVLKNVRSGLMPKDDGPRPTTEEIAQLEQWVKYQAFAIDPANPDPGRVTVRRLNRAEYKNTIHDLMGIDFASDVEFPPDDTGHGFDNQGEVLTVSPLLLEKYLQAAEEIVEKAVPRVSRVPVKLIATARDFKRVDNPTKSDGGEKMPPAPPAGGGNGAPRSELNARKGGKISHTFNAKIAGTYKMALKADVRSTFDFDGGRATVIVVVDDQEKSRQDIQWGSKPVEVSSEQLWKEGPHVVTIELVPLSPLEDPKPKVEEPAPAPPTEAPVQVVPPAQAVAAAGPIPLPAAPEAAAVAGAAGAAKAGDLPLPPRRPPDPHSVDFRITSVEMIGPMEKDRWIPPENYRRFFPEDVPASAKARDVYAQTILRDFATKAFRRPVDDKKLGQLVSMAQEVYTQPNGKFEDGIARAIMGVLASPRFLFRSEDTAAAESSRPFAAVDEYSLASRLSYFLWSSMPDEELFRLAGKGELRQQLPQQIARMQKDPKAQAFVKNFPGQWLQARDIETVEINAKAVLGLGNARGNVNSPIDLNGALRRMMRSETEMYFDYVMREDRSVLEFVESDYAFLNSKLATHYGVKDVTGDEIKRFTLPPDSPRGGLLTQGTILAVTSNPTRTSPVKRGLFVLENFLGTPPPPPPPDIPPLEEAKKAPDGRELTIREALSEHRANALCASCHARMDPLGFALENFNAMGNWRDKDAKQPIEAAGQLVTGEKFSNIRELKHVIATDRRLDYYRCLTEKMLTYALGRSLDYYDVEAVDQIVARLERNQGKFSALLYGIIESVPFQKQRNLRFAGPSASAEPAPAGKKVSLN